MQGRELGPWLIVVGVLLVLAGVAAWSGALSWLGRLPGDIRIEGGRTRVLIPITSMVVVSLVLSAVLSLVSWWFRTRR
jgi:protein-S-isoprenylcysteine O-methyltransferase Ste14